MSSRIRTLNRRRRFLHLQCYMVRGDVKEPTHLSKRVRDVVPGVVVNLSMVGWVGEIKNGLTAAA